MVKREGKVAQTAVIEHFVWPITKIEVEPHLLELLQPYVNEILYKIDNLRDFQKQWSKDHNVIRKDQHETFWQAIALAISDGVTGLVKVDGDLLLINFPACYHQYDRRFDDADSSYPKVGFQYIHSLVHEMNDGTSRNVPAPYTIQFTRAKMSVKFAENGWNE